MWCDALRCNGVILLTCDATRRGALLRDVCWIDAMRIGVLCCGAMRCAALCYVVFQIDALLCVVVCVAALLGV